MSSISIKPLKQYEVGAALAYSEPKSESTPKQYEVGAALASYSSSFSGNASFSSCSSSSSSCTTIA